MPARRLPWLKLWPEAMRHEKVALLTDGQFRSWISVLAASAEQPVRGRFASLQHAVVVTGRPSGDLQHLLAVGLLDYAEGALWVHDWSQWQDKYPSDYTEPEHSANTPGTLREHSTNGPAKLPLDTEERVKKREVKREEGDTPTPNPFPASGAGERADRRRRRAVEIPEPPPAPLAQVSAEDVALWRTALHAIRDGGRLSDGNLEQLCLLEPMGRDDAGGLHLRAPPGLGLERFQRNIALALADAGDAAAQGVVIREG